MTKSLQQHFIRLCILKMTRVYFYGALWWCCQNSIKLLFAICCSGIQQSFFCLCWFVRTCFRILVVTVLEFDVEYYSFAQPFSSRALIKSLSAAFIQFFHRVKGICFTFFWFSRFYRDLLVTIWLLILVTSHLNERYKKCMSVICYLYF